MHVRVLSLFAAFFSFFRSVAKLCYQKTVALEDQLKLFHFCGTVQQVLKDFLHSSVRVFMSGTVLLHS